MCVELVDFYEVFAEMKKQGGGVASVASVASHLQTTEITEEFFDQVAKPVAKVAKDCFGHGDVEGEKESMSHAASEGLSEPIHEDVLVYGLDAEGARVARVPKISALMINENTGSPLHCIHCGRWHHSVGQPWWCGECDICGEKKSRKDRCSILSVEWLEGLGYAVADGCV